MLVNTAHFLSYLAHFLSYFAHFLSYFKNSIPLQAPKIKGYSRTDSFLQRYYKGFYKVLARGNLKHQELWITKNLKKNNSQNQHFYNKPKIQISCTLFVIVQKFNRLSFNSPPKGDEKIPLTVGLSPPGPPWHCVPPVHFVYGPPCCCLSMEKGSFLFVFKRYFFKQGGGSVRRWSKSEPLAAVHRFSLCAGCLSTAASGGGGAPPPMP